MLPLNRNTPLKIFAYNWLMQVIFYLQNVWYSPNSAHPSLYRFLEQVVYLIHLPQPTHLRVSKCWETTCMFYFYTRVLLYLVFCHTKNEIRYKIGLKHRGVASILLLHLMMQLAFIPYTEFEKCKRVKRNTFWNVFLTIFVFIIEAVRRPSSERSTLCLLCKWCEPDWYSK